MLVSVWVVALSLVNPWVSLAQLLVCLENKSSLTLVSLQPGGFCVGFSGVDATGAVPSS